MVMCKHGEKLYMGLREVITEHLISNVKDLFFIFICTILSKNNALTVCPL